MRWSNRMESASVLPLLRSRFDEHVPPSVNIEITTDCNYGCSFCPQSSRRRPSKAISRDAMAHVVTDLKDIRFDGLVVLAVNNEPFLHPDLMSFCEMISGELPGAECLLVSNGSLVTVDHLRFLSRLERRPMLLVNDYTENREVSARIREMLASIGTAPALPVTIKARSRAEKLSNRAGNQGGNDATVADYRDVVCTWPFGGLFLSADLEAFLCCSDYMHEVILGNMKAQRLMDIWTGAPYRDIRRRMLATQRADIELCRRCDAEWFSLPAHCAKRGTPGEA